MICPHGTLLVVVGPTAVGKTDISVHVARRLGGEIVSADSRLVYRLMDIGTAKPDAKTRAEIPHHMIDVAFPDRQYTAKEYEVEARKVIGEILGRKRVPIVVGGTGLYVRALLKGIFEGPSADKALRASLEDAARRDGPEVLWRKLAEVDPEKARQIGPANVQRIIRALEVFDLTGSPMSSLEKKSEPFGLPSIKIGLMRKRPDLYQRIEQRVDRMVELGLLDEVRGLVGRGYGQSAVVRNSLGYREVMLYLEGAIPLHEAVRLMKRSTRNFAKRQMTWFAREPDVAWIDPTGREDHETVAGEICTIYESASEANRPQSQVP